MNEQAAASVWQPDGSFRRLCLVEHASPLQPRIYSTASRRNLGGKLALTPMSILKSELSAVLRGTVLPRLAATDLAALACSNRGLRQLVYDSDPRIWVTAARHCLPFTYPLPEHADRASIQSTLDTYFTARRGVEAGHHSCKVVPGHTSFSPTGTFAAFLRKENLSVYEVQSGQELLTIELTAPFSSWREPQFHWSNAGTRGAVVLFDEDDRVVMAKEDMLDPKVAQHGLQAMTQIWLPDNILFDGRFIALSTGHSRVLVTGRYPGTQDKCTVLVADADSGAALWSCEVQHLDSMAWHPSGQSFFLTTIAAPDTPQQTIHTHEVTLADKVMRRCPFGPGNDKAAELDGYTEDYIEMSSYISVSRDGRWLCRQRPQVDDGHEGDQINEFLCLTEATMVTLDGAQMDCMPWGKDSSKVVCHFDARVCIYQPGKPDLVGTYLVGESFDFRAGLCWSPDDRYVAAASYHVDRDCSSSAKISVWIFEACQNMHVVAKIVLPTGPNVEAINSLEWSPNYACLAVQLYGSGSLLQPILISFAHF